jgi:hypothetical protein
MSFGNSPADGAFDRDKYDRLRAKADVDRAGRLAGYKPLWRRLLERLRPHREGPGSNPQNFPGTPSDPAQNTSNATATTVMAGSLISAQRIG